MIQKKLLQLQEKGIALKKDASNPFFKSRYITLDNIIETYNPLFNELKIVCYHHTIENKLTTVLFDTEDETSVSSQFNVLNTDPQKQGSEITYGKRYNLWQLLNIQTDLDDDWNKASSSWNTKAHYKNTETKWNYWDYSCSKCWVTNESPDIKQGKYWPYFICSECNKFSDNKNPVFDWEDLSKQAF